MPADNTEGEILTIKDEGQKLVWTYVISDEMAECLAKVMIPQLSFNVAVDHKICGYLTPFARFYGDMNERMDECVGYLFKAQDSLRALFEALELLTGLAQMATQGKEEPVKGRQAQEPARDPGQLRSAQGWAEGPDSAFLGAENGFSLNGKWRFPC